MPTRPEDTSFPRFIPAGRQRMIFEPTQPKALNEQQLSASLNLLAHIILGVPVNTEKGVGTIG